MARPRRASPSLTTYANGDGCPAAPEGCPETNSKPDWSPNGASIAWTIFDSKAQNGYLFRMSAGGGAEVVPVPFGSVGLGCPQNSSFSPDGKRLVFSDGVYCNPPGGEPAQHLGPPGRRWFPDPGCCRLSARLGPAALGGSL